MPKPLSNEIREKIIEHKQNGVTEKTIAEWLIISERSVSRICSIFRKTGKIEPLPKNCGRKSAVSEEKMKEVIAEIERCPDITLGELREKFELNLSIPALSKKLKKLGFTYKKRLYTQMLKKD